MKFCYLFLVLAVAAVNAEVTDINKFVDIGFAKLNKYLREHRYTSLNIPVGSFGPKITFLDSDVLGLDSLKRTANCTLEVVGDNATLDYHYGFGFFQQSFKYLDINGQGMSASYRIRDNSVRLYYTVQNIGKVSGCSVILHDVSYEKMAGVSFSSSRSEYDGLKLDPFFKEAVIPYLNGKINKPAVEKALERFSCRPHHLDVSEHMPMVHQTIVELLGAFSY